MMKYLRQACRTYSGLLLAGAVLFQASFLPAQAPSAGSGSPVGLRPEGQAIPIAVVEFEGNGISQTEAIALTDRLRNELFRLGAFEVVERGMMETILAEQDFQLTGCTSNECLVEVGQLLGARRVVGGRISRVGAMFTVSARVVDVETGKLLGVSDFDLRGGLEEMLTGGMKQVAVMLSREDVGARDVTGQREAKPDFRSMEIRQTQPNIPRGSKPHPWQARLGLSYWKTQHEYFYVHFCYEFESEFSLMQIRFHPAISGGLLYRTYYYEEWWRGGGEGDGDYFSESIPYGMIEAHKKLSVRPKTVVVSLYGGIGLGKYDYSYYYDWDRDVEKKDGISLVLSVGTQVRIQTPILPILICDINFFNTQEYGSSITYSLGLQVGFSE